MDATVKKTLYIGLGTVTAAIIGAFAYYEIRLWLIYSKVSTVDQADALLQQPNTLLVDISDPPLDVSTDDTQYQYNSDGADWLDAVEINGDVYTGDSNTQIYTDYQGNVYNGNANTITYVNGDVDNVDSSEVQYGSIDNNGNFVND